MTYVSRTYRLYAGQYGIIDPELVGSTPLVVKREGTGFDVTRNVTDPPGARETAFDSPNGTLRFLNPGENLADPSLPYDQTERVFVLFKY